MGIAGNLLVLLVDASRGIDHHEDHIRPVDGTQGAYDAVPFHRILDLPLAAHARRVDQCKLRPVLGEMGVDCIPCGAGDIAHDDPVLPEDLVDDGGFPHIGPSNDRNADLILILFLCFHLGKSRHDGIQKVPEIQCIGGRNPDGVPQPQLIEFIDIHFPLGAVHLVHRQDHGLLRASEEPPHFLVRGSQPCTPIHHKDDDIGLLHGNGGLFPHGGQDMIALIELNAARINHGELMLQPFRIQIDPVPGHPRHIVHDGDTLLPNLVEQRRFPHIRAPHNRHNRLAHSLLYLLICPFSPRQRKSSGHYRP